VDETALVAALQKLPTHARDQLRRLLVRDQADRDTVARQALRNGRDDLADVIDLLTLDDELRRATVRVLGEIEASGRGAPK
jgi:hypothetical protein